MLKEPFQLLAKGVRAVETINADVIALILVQSVRRSGRNSN
jgi:hypothetical protein